LDGLDLLKPMIDIQVVGGAAGIDGSVIRDSLVRLQYTSKQGKGRMPMFNLELDNENGKVFNWSVAVIGLTLRIQFGYAARMSKPYLATVRAVKAAHMPYAGGQGGQRPNSPRPDVYGMVIMEAQAHDWPLNWRPEAHNWGPSEPMRLSQAIKRIAQLQGYPTNKIHVEEGGTNDPVGVWQIRDDETVLGFMERHAKADMGYVVKASDKEIHFHSRTWSYAAQEDIAYFIGPDLLSFSVDGDYTLNTQKVAGKGFNALLGLRTTHVVGPEGLPTGALGVAPGGMKNGKVKPTGPDSKPGKVVAEDSISPRDVVTSISSKVVTSAVRRLVSVAQNKWVIKMTLVGNPVVTEGVGLILDNFGPVVDGVWIAKEVEHRIDNDGYTTMVSAVGKKTGAGQCTTRSVHIDDLRANYKLGALAVTTCGGRNYNKRGQLKTVKRKKGSGKSRPVSATKSLFGASASRSGYDSGHGAGKVPR